MPGRDGRGPMGFGPRSGRGMGWCRGLLRGRFSLRRAGFWSALVPVCYAAIRDAANPDGFLRSLHRKLLSNRKPEKENNAIKADYEVIDNSKSEQHGENYSE